MSELQIRRIDSLPPVGMRQASTMYITKGVGDKIELFFTDQTNTDTYRLLNQSDIETMLSGIVLPTSDEADKLSTPRHISASGDANWDVIFDGSGNASAALTLVTTGISAGEKTVYTVDSKGRVTASRALITSDIPDIPGSKIVSTISVNTTGNAATATKLTTARTINGVAFDGTGNITVNAVDSTARVAVTEKGAPNGVATLDSGGKIPSSQLASYVDDIIEIATYSVLPATGSGGVLYVVLDTNKIYRWDGLVYVQLTGGVALADSTAKLVTPRSISMTGDASWTVSFDGSENASANITLSNSGVTAGSYSKPTVDAKGRVTVGANTSNSEFNTALGFSPVNRAGDTLTSALNYVDPTTMDADIDSDLSLTDSNVVRVTGGVSDIVSLGVLPAGAMRYLIFDSDIIITHNAVSLILPTGRNILARSGDVALMKSLGSGNWQCTRYQYANGVLAGGTFNGVTYLKRGADIASAATLNLDSATGDIVNVTGTATITAITLSDGAVRRVRFTGALTLTNGENLQLLANANMTTVAGDWAEFVGLGGGVVAMMMYSSATGLPVTASSTETLSNKTFVDAVFNGFIESGPTVSGTSHTVNLVNGTDIDATTTGPFTLTLPSPAGNAGKSFTVTINYGGAHAFGVSGTVRWVTGTAPTATSINGKADRYTFVCNRAGTAWFGIDAGRYF